MSLVIAVFARPYDGEREQAWNVPCRERAMRAFALKPQVTRHSSAARSSSSVPRGKVQPSHTSQQQQIVGLLPAHGWEVVPSERPDRWWLADCWSLRSTWSPVGERAWILFLAAPQEGDTKPSAPHAWAVAVAREIPERWQDCECVPLRPKWQTRGLHEFTAILGRLRPR